MGSLGVSWDIVVDYDGMIWSYIYDMNLCGMNIS